MFSLPFGDISNWFNANFYSFTQGTSPESDDAMINTKCSCKGKCRRACPCKQAGIYCRDSECGCSKERCDQRKESYSKKKKKTCKRRDEQTIPETLAERSEAAYTQVKVSLSC